MKIVILNSYVYKGGPLVISQLCAELRKLGYDARLLMVPSFPNEKCTSWKYRMLIIFYQFKVLYAKLLKNFFPHVSKFNIEGVDLQYTQLEGVKYYHIPFIGKKTIVVYPETVYGNPLNAKYVVRWLLYYYKFEKDYDAYSKEDLFICYRKVFNSPQLNPNCFEVKINYFNKHLYRQYNFEHREGNCFILRKGKGRHDLPSNFDGPVFDNNMSQEELVDIFNRCKFCYDYDTQTFYAQIAAVCGCIPITMFEKGSDISESRGSEEQNHYGIAWGNSAAQIQYAIETRGLLLQELDFTEDNKLNAEKFIDILKEKYIDLI